METFEKVFKEKFKTQLEAIITDRNIEFVNDLKFDGLNNPDDIAVIIKTGPGANSNITGYDITSLNFSVMIISNSEKLEELLGELNSFIANHNAVWDTVNKLVYDVDSETTIDTTFKFRPFYTNPFVNGNQYNIKTNSSSIQAVNLLMNVEVQYSSTAAIEPPTWELEINSVKYPINAISNWETTVNPNYDSSSVINEDVPTQDLHSVAYVFKFSLNKITGDALHDILSLEAMKDKNNALYKSNTINLYRDNDYVGISTYIVSEVWENGVTIIHLTLGR